MCGGGTASTVYGKNTHVGYRGALGTWASPMQEANQRANQTRGQTPRQELAACWKRAGLPMHNLGLQLQMVEPLPGCTAAVLSAARNRYRREKPLCTALMPLPARGSQAARSATRYTRGRERCTRVAVSGLEVLPSPCPLPIARPRSHHTGCRPVRRCSRFTDQGSCAGNRAR